MPEAFDLGLNWARRGTGRGNSRSVAMAKASVGGGSRANAATHDLTSLLDSIERRIEQDGPSPEGKLSLKEILQVVGHRAYGPMLLIIGILSVSPLSLIPGSTWTFAILTLLVATEMAFHKRHPWLPESALKASFPETKIQAALKKVRPFTKTVDKIVRPRLEFLAGEPWLAMVALVAIAAALITFPLSFIPLAPFIPGVTIILIGLGITARDGVLLGLAMLIVCAGGYWLASRWL